MKHGIKYKPVARDKYNSIMKFEEGRRISWREIGIVISPSAVWFGASRDGLLYDCESGNQA